VDRLRFALDAARPLGDDGTSVLRFGGAVDRTESSYGAHRLGAVRNEGADAEVTGTVAGGYVDASARASDAVVLRLGLRADRFSSDAGLRLAPRVSILWNLSDAALLTLAAGRYHQFARATDAQVATAVESLAGGVANAPAGPTGPLPVATADHLVLSLDQRIEPGVRLGIQGFFKSFSSFAGLPRSHSSGLDLRVVAEGEELSGWLGYSLAWFWSEDQRAGASTSDFTGRHLLSAGLTGRLAGPLGMDLRVAFSDGLPFTSIRYDAAEVPPGTVAPETPRDDGNEFRDAVETGTPVLSGGPADGFLRVGRRAARRSLPIWGRRVALRPYIEDPQRARSPRRAFLVLRSRGATPQRGRSRSCRSLPVVGPGVAVLS
jgi:hypothetical protein